MIIVTGASKGLGRAICERLLSSGIEIFGLPVDITNIPFKSMNCDVSSYDDVKQVARALKRDDKKISGLINAAGVASMNLAVTTPPSITEKIITDKFAGHYLLLPNVLRR